MSCGHDELPMKIVKLCINNILTPLTHIINLSLMTGVVPQDLKIAKVIPIYKTSSKDELKNYRPVSLLPAFSKVLEKIVFDKIMKYFNEKNLFYEHQYGFRRKHTTVHPIIHLLNVCAKADNRHLTASILCDLSKAFDVINYDILFEKLDHYGIRGIAKNWLVNYLSNRKQYVVYENAKSKQCKIDCGVKGLYWVLFCS